MMHAAGVPACLITGSDRIRINWMLVMIPIVAEKVKFVGSIALKLLKLQRSNLLEIIIYYDFLITAY